MTTPNARRRLLTAASLLVLVRPAAATPGRMAKAIAAYTGNIAPKSGRVTFEIAQLVDNGNAVPVTIRVDSPMTPADHVTGIALFNEKNPEADVIRCTLGPRAGKAEISTRIRLATSQRLTAVGKLSDGSCWQQTADVIVTLAACIEGEAP